MLGTPLQSCVLYDLHQYLPKASADPELQSLFVRSIDWMLKILGSHTQTMCFCILGYKFDEFSNFTNLDISVFVF